ncbi:hypothetical protein EDB86DRAFT_2954393 [Lactarius hatsudake]|nr:hypothetical protein EDB86DRAFT_2954393 [Lactarius hatsudake]
MLLFTLLFFFLVDHTCYSPLIGLIPSLLALCLPDYIVSSRSKCAGLYYGHLSLAYHIYLFSSFPPVLAVVI